MLGFQFNPLPIAGAWAMAILILGWPYLPDAWRRALSLLASLAGLVFVIAAVNTEGLREVPTVSDFLIGPAYVLTPVSALASLPYYLLTAVCELLALGSLAAGERAAAALRRRPLAAAVTLTLAVALLRFAFEKAAAPVWLARLFGVAWLPPVVGGLLYSNLRGMPRLTRCLARELAVYALVTRAVIVLFYVAASTWRLGSHYDIVPVTRLTAAHGWSFTFEPGSPRQFVSLVLMPQLTFWVAYTVVAGLLGALAARGLHRLPGIRQPRRAPRPVPTSHPASSAASTPASIEETREPARLTQPGESKA